MKPKILTIDPYNVSLDLIKQAAEGLKNRRLVAFPTETVYGLGAIALDSKAVAEIFQAKNRPLDDPLIVHISKMDDLYRLTQDVPKQIEKLVNCFWPGPLTVVLKKTQIVPDIVTTGLDTVAIRMPSNMIARQLIDVVGEPISAPSANLFGRPSPTTAKHVLEDLEGKIDILIDGGVTDIGVESTVIAYIDEKIKILRPGGISLEEIKKIVQEVEVYTERVQDINSPGQYPQHYSPKAKLILMKPLDSVQKILDMVDNISKDGSKVGIMAKQENATFYKNFNVKVLGPEQDGKICASRLFVLLREFDVEQVDVIIAESISEKGLGLAVMNRLHKAAGSQIEFDF